MRHMKKTIYALVLIALLGGCASRGPSTISTDRPAYNMAVQRTNDQELLLNLVRLLYRDTLYFTNVERIAATQEFNQGIGASSQSTSTSNSFAVNQTTGSAIASVLANSFTFGPGSVAINEKPTVFYAPLEGEKFVRQMMTPMNPDLLLMLVKSGWPLDLVFSVGVQEMNGLKNAPTAAGPTPSREPEFHAFREAVLLLRALQRDQLIDLAKAKNGDGIELRFIRTAAKRAETIRLKSLLGLSAEQNRFLITSGVESPDDRTIAMTTRPLLSSLYYVSQGIEAPPEHIKAGKVRRTVRADLTAFDWQQLLDGIFRVRASKELPDEASVVVHYRGHYFYIADNELEVKATFVLLTQLMALHSTPSSTGPAISFSLGK